MSTPLTPRADDGAGPPDAGTAGPGGTTKSAAAKLFDIRLLIGGLFLVYGVLLSVAGLFSSASARAKADGININLWLGLGMLVVGGLFVLWLRLRPLVHDVVPDDGEAPRPAH